MMVVTQLFIDNLFIMTDTMQNHKGYFSFTKKADNFSYASSFLLNA